MKVLLKLSAEPDLILGFVLRVEFRASWLGRSLYSLLSLTFPSWRVQRTPVECEWLRCLKKSLLVFEKGENSAGPSPWCVPKGESLLEVKLDRELRSSWSSLWLAQGTAAQLYSSGALFEL